MKKPTIVCLAVNILAFAAYILVTTQFYLGVYSVSLWTGTSIGIIVGCSFFLLRKGVSKTRQRILNAVCWTVTIASVITFVLFMPAYTVGDALKVLEQDYGDAYTFTINEKTPVMQTTGSGHWFVKHVYIFKASGEDAFEVRFNPSEGTYWID